MFDALFAALVSFTRLPLWRLREVPAASFRDMVAWWPLVGWLTGGVTAAVLLGAAQLLPAGAAVVAAFGCRLLLTGAFHEDGLGDFFDGFGGGTSRERILAIMKDSRSGSYGVLGLIFYYGLVWSLLCAMPTEQAVLVIAAGDPLAKGISAQLINLLPYARREEESKVRVVYNRMSWPAILFTLLCGVLPLLLLLPCELWCAAGFPIAAMCALVWMMKRRLGGYTGDCCGASFLLCEAAFYVGITVVISTLS